MFRLSMSNHEPDAATAIYYAPDPLTHPHGRATQRSYGGTEVSLPPELGTSRHNHSLTLPVAFIGVRHSSARSAAHNTAFPFLDLILGPKGSPPEVCLAIFVSRMAINPDFFTFYFAIMAVRRR